jgi:hypothetical protein
MLNLHHSGYEVDWQLPVDAQVLDDQRVGTSTKRPARPGHRWIAASFSPSPAETNGATVTAHCGHGSASEADHPVGVVQ